MPAAEIGTGGIGATEDVIAEDVIVVVGTDVARLRRFLRSRHELTSPGRMQEAHTARWKLSPARF
jgi:hypothetical protein